MKPDCLNPKCQNQAVTRGLCSGCYALVFKLIATGETTWQELEIKGKVLPKKKSKSSWFLE